MVKPVVLVYHQPRGKGGRSSPVRVGQDSRPPRTEAPAASGRRGRLRAFTPLGRRRPSQPVLAQGDSGSPGLLIQRQVQALSDGLIAVVTLPGCPAWSNAGPWRAVLRVLIGSERGDSGAGTGRYKTLRHEHFRQRVHRLGVG